MRDTCLEEFAKGLNVWVRDLLRSEEGRDFTTDDFARYRERVLSVVGQMLAHIPDGARELTLDDALGPGDKRELHQLRNGFVISYVDKFATKFLFTCKRMYALRMLREFAPRLLDRYNLSVMLCCLSKQQTGWRVALGERSGGPRVLSFLGAPTQTGTYTMPCQPDGTSPETCETVIERHLTWLHGEGISYNDFMTRQKLHSDRGPPHLHLRTQWLQQNCTRSLWAGAILPARPHTRCVLCLRGPQMHFVLTW